MQTIGPHHWPEDAASVIDYYRADQRRHLLRTWLSSLLLVYLGCGLTVVPVLERHTSEAAGQLLGVLGLLTIALGVFCTIHGLFRGLCSERYISLRRDGLVVRVEGAPVLIAWNELEEVRHLAAEQCVLLVLNCGRELQLTDRYTGAEVGQLAKQIATVRRRALWGFYDRL